MSTDSDLQLEYYKRRAATYDEDHVAAHDEHQQSLRHISAYVRSLSLESVLDTGCGTGRGLRTLRAEFPNIKLVGNDPSRELLNIAASTHGISPDDLYCAGTLDVPFGDGSFDAVMSLGVLHHVPEPAAIVHKMVRLARRAIFISDSNYLGQGRFPVRFAKVALTKLGLWRAAKFVQQGFKPWAFSEGDGIHFSYSVFSNLPILQEACREVFVIPVGAGSVGAATWPMLRAACALVCAFK